MKKLSELRPCDECGGPIAPTFWVVRFSQAFIEARAANQVLGLSQMFQGAMALAELFAPADPVVVAGDEDPQLETEIILCTDCFYRTPFPILMERRSA